MGQQRTRFAFMWLLLGGLLCGGGCQLAGIVAAAAEPPDILPRYDGLMGQKVGVMVWVDRAIATDYRNLQLDTAVNVQRQLEEKAKDKDVLELKETTFPERAEWIHLYQKNNPRVADTPILEVAPKLANKTGLTRLIYLEVYDFGTRSPTAAAELFRGVIAARLKVLAIKDGKAEVVFELNDVKVVFPPKAGPDGVPNLDDQKVYMGTLGLFRRQVANLFITHKEEE